MSTLAALTLGGKQYKILGRMLCKKHPDLAKKLLSIYTDYIPTETDYKKIDAFFSKFCVQQGLNRNEYSGPLYKSSKVEKRRLFIAAMLRMYYPQVYHEPFKELNLQKNGFSTTLSKTIQVGQSIISSVIRDVVMWERQYEDFKAQVDRIVGKLKEKNVETVKQLVKEL